MKTISKKSWATLLTTMALALFSCTLTSCGDDETEKDIFNTPNWLLGRWQETSNNLFSHGAQETYFEITNSRMRVYVVPTSDAANALGMTKGMVYLYTSITIYNFSPSSDTAGLIDTDAGSFAYKYVNDSTIQLSDSEGTYTLKKASFGEVNMSAPDNIGDYIY